MRKSPGLFIDLGRKASELLHKDYRSEQSVTITTYSPTGFTLKATGKNKGGLFLADMSTKLVNKNITTDVRVDNWCHVYTKITVDEPTPGLKAIVSYDLPDGFRKGISPFVELQYLHEHVGISSSIWFYEKPLIMLSAVFGTNTHAWGADVGFVGSKLVKCNAGVSFSKADVVASVKVRCISASHSCVVKYYHTISSITAVGAEVSYDFSPNRTLLIIGTQHSLDHHTLVKARVNSYGVANALIQHEWRPKSHITIFGEVDIRAIEKSAKIGLALALTP